MVTIGIPAFKPQYLHEALGSVLAQTYPDFEVIISNSGRNEIIREIVASFSDPRIRYAEVDAMPVVDHWNLVLSKAAGEYFVLFSDDDVYDPRFLEVMLALARDYPPCAVFHCRVRRIDASGREMLVTPECRAFETGLEFILGRIRGERQLFAADFICKTDVLKATGGFTPMPGAWGTDDLTWFRMSLQGGIAYTPEVLFSWRTSPAQISSSMPVITRLDAVLLYSDWVRQLVTTFNPADENEQVLLKMIGDALEDGIGNQKNYLMLLHAGMTGVIGHFSFFLKNRRKYTLSWRGFLYSLLKRQTSGMR